VGYVPQSLQLLGVSIDAQRSVIGQRFALYVVGVASNGP
jgi:hypothetical protein